MFKLVLLAVGLATAVYLGRTAPREQHLRVVLGSSASEVTRVGIQYVAPDGDVAREATMTYAPGTAPRVVSHEPSLPDGDYRLRIELDTLDARRSVESRVTLGGGSTQVDVTGALAAKP